DVNIESVEMADWEMLVEKWEDRQNFPKFGDDSNEPDKPKWYTVTMRSMRAYRGQFTYADHEKPWSIVARHLDLRIGNLPTYNGEATCSGGTVTIEDNLPMWLNMRARFEIGKKGKVHLDRIDFDSDGASSFATGDVDLGNFPEMTFQVTSRVNFPRMREIFFTNETWRVSGEGGFKGVFHLFKGGHDLHGTFTSELAGVNQYRFPSLYASLKSTPKSFDVS